MKILEKSEFGKGLTVCLGKFLEHFGTEQVRHIYFIDMYKNKSEVEQKVMISDNPPDNLNYGEVNGFLRFYIEDMLPIYDNDIDKAISREIELWASGATDHLYEIEAPEGKGWGKIRGMVKELKDTGLKMGHGLNKDRLWIKEDIGKLNELALKILFEIDKKIGLEPDIGKW